MGSESNFVVAPTSPITASWWNLTPIYLAPIWPWAPTHLPAVSGG